MNYAKDIVNSVPASELLPYYGITPNRAGFCRCCFHSEKTASLKIYPGNKGWYCFGCHAGGNVIDFVMRYFGLDFKGAVAKINTDFSLGLPIGKKISLRDKRKMEDRRKELNAEKEKHENLQQAYNAALDEWCRLDQNMERYRPKSPDEALHPLFVEACKKIEYVSEALDAAEKRLRDFENR